LIKLEIRFITAWKGFHVVVLCFFSFGRKIVLSVNYDFTKLKDELQLCALILSYSPKNESTWSHRYSLSFHLSSCQIMEFGETLSGHLLNNLGIF
jgi:hypothetical protein